MQFSHRQLHNIDTVMKIEILGFRNICYKIRYMHCNRKCIKLLFKTVAILTFCFVLIIPMSVFIYYQYFVRCSEIKGRNQITEMCRLYHAGDIIGSMCSTLCDKNKVQYSQCAGNNDDKEVEILYCEECVRDVTQNLRERTTTSKVVLKSEVDMKRWDSNVQIQFFDTESTEDKANRIFSNIVSQIRSHFQIDLSNDKHLLNFFIGDNYTNAIKNLNKSKADTIVFRNIAALSAQTEFLAMKAFSGLSFIPKLYGTCGPAYLVEYVAPLSTKNYVLFQGKISEVIKLDQRQPSWTERATVALYFLNLIREVENVFKRPLHICDVSPGNFGVNSTGGVVLPDLGRVYFERFIPKLCEDDSQCDFYTCRGVCDINGTHRCKREMKATNLQIICEHMFLSRIERFGLLRNPPVKVADKLKILLHRCAYTNPRLIRLPKDNYSDQQMTREFEDILKASLDMNSYWWS